MYWPFCNPQRVLVTIEALISKVRYLYCVCHLILKKKHCDIKLKPVLFISIKIASRRASIYPPF